MTGCYNTRIWYSSWILDSDLLEDITIITLHTTFKSWTRAIAPTIAAIGVKYFYSVNPWMSNTLKHWCMIEGQNGKVTNSLWKWRGKDLRQCYIHNTRTFPKLYPPSISEGCFCPMIMTSQKVVANLRKARNTWMGVLHILVWGGVDTKTSGMFFKAVVNNVLLFGSEMCVISPHLLGALGMFHKWVTLRINGRKPWRNPYRSCV